MPEQPFWSDDFDMDLPKVIPQARGLLGPTADVILYTHGSTSYGRLNGPNLWNGYYSMQAFFGFMPISGRIKPVSYYTESRIVECTFWEAVRDAWPHGYCIYIHGHPLWDTFRLYRHFERMMYDLRGWSHCSEARRMESKREVIRTLLHARRKFERLMEQYAVSVPGLAVAS